MRDRIVLVEVVRRTLGDGTKTWWPYPLLTQTNGYFLREGHLEKQAPEVITSPDYRLYGPISQRQRRLTGAQVVEMAAKYEAGATVYELAAEFGCHRTTIAERLKKAGISMRGQSTNARSHRLDGANIRVRTFAAGSRQATRILCEYCTELSTRTTYPCSRYT